MAKKSGAKAAPAADGASVVENAAVETAPAVIPVAEPVAVVAAAVEDTPSAEVSALDQARAELAAAREKGFQRTLSDRVAISELVPFFGRVPDADLAGWSGLSDAQVATARRKRNVANFDEAPTTAKSHPKLDALRHRLGNESDDVIAQETGLTVAAVRQYRHSFGIKLSDDLRSQIAAKRRGSVLDALRDKIGVLSDTEVAALANVTAAAVAGYRRRLGIVSTTDGRKTRTSVLVNFTARLGKEADEVIAAEAGVTVAAVRQFRGQHGILLDASVRRRRGPAPAVAATAAAAHPAQPAAAPRTAKPGAAHVYRVDGLLYTAANKNDLHAHLMQKFGAAKAETLSVEYIGPAAG